MKGVLIAGGSGLVGERLTELLLKKGYTVHILSRSDRESNRKNLRYFCWDPRKAEIAPDAWKDVAYVVNLAGANIAGKRWTRERKEALEQSRLQSTNTLVKAIAERKAQIEGFISASAVGYYGDESKVLLNEQSPQGKDFLATLCGRWEHEALEAQQAGIRTIIFRIGIVLSSRGGAMPQLALPVKLFAGSPMGSGEQVMPWIHIDDLCEMMIWGMEKPAAAGVYNAAAPNPVTNRQFFKALARHFHRPLFLPRVPAFLLKTLLGEMSVVVTGSSPVSSRKVQEAGFHFSHTELPEAIGDVYKHKV